MAITEKRKIENKLLMMGLKKLSDPGLVEQLGRLIPNEDILLGMINECDEEKRSEMYDAIRPHLKFHVRELDYYVNKIKERANAAASRAQPISIGEEQYAQCREVDATMVIIDFRCHSCGRMGMFHAKTPVTAVILARQAGWVHDNALNKEICPRCPTDMRSERRKCPVCRNRHFAPSCSAIGYLGDVVKIQEEFEAELPTEALQ